MRQTLFVSILSLEMRKDMPSEVEFPVEKIRVVRGVDTVAVIPIVRLFTDKGRAAVAWSTREHTAESGRDFVDSEGLAVFEDGQTEAFVRIPLLNPTETVQDATFIVELGATEGDTSVGRYEIVVAISHTDDDVTSGECFVVSMHEIKVHFYAVFFERLFQ